MHCDPPNQNFGWALAHPAYPVTPPWVLGDAVTVSFPSGVRGGAPTAVAFCCIECFQNASGRSILWSAVSGKMKANPGSGQIWYSAGNLPSVPGPKAGPGTLGNNPAQV